MKQNKNLKQFGKNKKVFISLSLIGLFLFSCDIQITDDHYLCASRNSIYSKQNKVFVESLDYVSGSIITKQRDTLEVLECFIEYEHNIKHNKEVVKWDGMQMIIVLKEIVPEDYDFEWFIIGRGSDYGFTRAHKNSLMISLDRLNQDDTIWLFINEGRWAKRNDKTIKTISEISFVKQSSVKDVGIDSTNFELIW